MKPRTLLVLFVLVAGLGAFVWFYERELPGSDERAERAKQLFPDLDSDAVTGLELATEKGTVILQRRRPPGGDEDDGETSPAAGDVAWRLVSPLEARADDAAVSAVLSTLGDLERKRTLEGVDPAEAGLDEPRARVTIRRGKEETILSIGRSVPASGDVLVALGGAPPYYVTGGRIVEQIEKAPGEWRDPALFPWMRADVDRLRVTTPAGELLLARRGEDVWVEEPFADRADPAAVSRLLTALTGLRAERFVDEPAAESGLEEPEARLEVVVRGREEPFRVALGARIEAEPPRRYARVAGQEVEITDQLSGAVAGDPERWRSRDWSSLEAFAIDRVEITHESEELVLERAGGDWKRGEATIPFSVASDLLYAITDAVAQDVDEGTLLAESRLRIVLESEERSETLELFAPDDGRHPATVGDRSVVLWLDDETVSDVEEKLKAVREAESDVEDAEDVDEVTTNSSS